MNVVTYGSLMFGEVMFALLNHDFPSEAVLLTNYARFKMAGKRYPGLIWTPGEKVQGRIYFDLDDDSLDVLDQFEDEAYERKVLEINTQSRGIVSARGYVIPEEGKEFLSADAWSPDEFLEVHLQEYISMCRRFRNRIRP